MLRVCSRRGDSGIVDGKKVRGRKRKGTRDHKELDPDHGPWWWMNQWKGEIEGPKRKRKKANGRGGNICLYYSRQVFRVSLRPTSSIVEVWVKIEFMFIYSFKWKWIWLIILSERDLREFVEAKERKIKRRKERKREIKKENTDLKKERNHRFKCKDHHHHQFGFLHG